MPSAGERRWCLILTAVLILHKVPEVTPAACTETRVCVMTDRVAKASDVFNSCKFQNRHLILQNNGLTVWNTKDIEATSPCAPNVEILELHNVTSTDILNTGEPFKAFTKMRRLVINANINFSIDASLFQNHPLLKELVISRSAVRKLKSTHLFGLTALENLTIADSFLYELDKDAIEKSIPKVVNLDLSNNNISVLSNTTFGKKDFLRSLNLDGNSIQYIELMAFYGLTELETLSIKLPKDRTMAKIWEKSLEGRFSKNTKLQTLRLIDTKMSDDQIKGAFTNLKELRELNLSGNIFHFLHQSILSSMEKLEVLDMSFCQLYCLHDRNFGILSKLTSLRLANNSITYIGQRAFEGLKSLTTLDLRGNPIQIIEEGSFCTLKKLQGSKKELLRTSGISESAYRGKDADEDCPEGFIPDKLSFGKIRCPIAETQKNLQSEKERSRNYLLIIVGLCVGFLLITILSIVTYRNWSRRKNAQIQQDEDKEMEMQAMIEPKPEENGKHHGNNTKAKPPAADTPEGERSPRPRNHSDSKSAAPSQPQKPMSPKAQKSGMTAMATLPEDGDLEAKAVTTLAVV